MIRTEPHKHLALFLSALSGGGAQRRMVTLANAFAAGGDRVDLVVPRPDGSFRAELSPRVAVISLDRWWTRVPWVGRTKTRWVLASVPQLAAYLRDCQPDVVLSTSNPANLAALWARQIAGVRTPIVVSVNVHISQAAARRRGVWRRFLAPAVRRFYPRANGIIAVADSVAEDLVKLTQLPRERIVTIHNPIATAAIERKASMPLNHPWFAAGEPPVVLAVGKLKRQKDFKTLIAAFARVRAARAARLIILGEGPERANLTRLVQQLGMSTDVDLPGFAANPFAYMARASVLAHSSLWEGFSNVVAEALACGCPVVATDCAGGTAELLDHGAYGRLVPVGAVDALAAAILSALSQPHDRAALRARASLFSEERAVEAYRRVLLQVCSRGAGAMSAEPDLAALGVQS